VIVESANDAIFDSGDFTDVRLRRVSFLGMDS